MSDMKKAFDEMAEKYSTKLSTTYRGGEKVNGSEELVVDHEVMDAFKAGCTAAIEYLRKNPELEVMLMRNALGKISLDKCVTVSGECTEFPTWAAKLAARVIDRFDAKFLEDK